MTDLESLALETVARLFRVDAHVSDGHPDPVDVVLAALRQAQQAADNWQPIETSPLTNSARLVWCPAYRNTYIVTWVVPLDEEARPDPGKGFWQHFGPGDHLGERPTHWQPLPATPESDLK